MFGCTWTSKSAENDGPISQTREYGQYRVHSFGGHFGGPGINVLARPPLSLEARLHPGLEHRVGKLDLALRGPGRRAVI